MAARELSGVWTTRAAGKGVLQAQLFTLQQTNHGEGHCARVFLGRVLPLETAPHGLVLKNKTNHVIFE